MTENLLYKYRFVSTLVLLFTAFEMGADSTMKKFEEPWNFSWVLPNELAATSCPETIENLGFLKQEGIRHLVTLSPEYIPPIRRFSGMEWTYIPVEEFEPPTLKDIQLFIEACEKARSKKEAIAIHCRAGRGRTGVMLACYLVNYLEMSPESAITKVRGMRPGSIETSGQARAVRDYRDYLRSNMN